MCRVCERKSIDSQLNYGDGFYIQCPSCGNYGITDVLYIEMLQINQEVKFKLSHLLAEYKLKELPPILLTNSARGNIMNFTWTYYIDLLKKYPTNALEIMDRTLLNLSKIVNHPSDKIRIDDNIKEFFFTNDISAVIYIIRQFAKQGYTSLITGTPQDITIEADGWKRILELKNKPEGLLEQAFVAMWFDKEMDKFYNEGIEPAIKNAKNYKVIKIDNIEHNNKICDQIVAEINKSKLVIADFTGSRGGVYFEAGYAQGKGIPVIWTVKEDWVKELHFDTRQYNHIVYNTPQELYEKLKVRIEATII